jgi:hypothetical protein
MKSDRELTTEGSLITQPRRKKKPRTVQAPDCPNGFGV